MELPSYLPLIWSQRVLLGMWKVEAAFLMLIPFLTAETAFSMSLADDFLLVFFKFVK